MTAGLVTTGLVGLEPIGREPVSLKSVGLSRPFRVICLFKSLIRNASPLMLWVAIFAQRNQIVLMILKLSQPAATNFFTLPL